MLDERGQNPLRILLVMLCFVFVLFVIVAFFTDVLDIIWGACEDAAAPNTPNIWDDLDRAWLMIPIIAVIALVVWGFAALHSREVEREMFIR